MGYVKRNAIAGHRFASLEALQAHLARWMREVADVRVHGTTGEPPIERFERDEASALRPLAGQGAVPAGARAQPSGAHRRLHRVRHQPLQRSLAADRRERHRRRSPSGQVRVLYAGQEVACHAQSPLRRSAVIERATWSASSARTWPA